MQGTKKIQKKLINLCVCLCGATPTKNIQFFDVETTPQVHGSESGCAFRSNVTRTSSQRTAPQRTGYCTHCDIAHDDRDRSARRHGIVYNLKLGTLGRWIAILMDVWRRPALNLGVWGAKCRESRVILTTEKKLHSQKLN